MKAWMADKLPVITRAREYHVYDVHGRRYLDLYQDDGRAILGHRPGKCNLELKNALSRGLAADYPSVYESQILKALRLLFPSCADIRLYPGRDEALAMVSLHLGREYSWEDVGDPARGQGSGGELSMWRPFLDIEMNQSAVFVPVLPFPGSWGPTAVVYMDPPDRETEPSRSVSPVVLAGLKRCLYDLIRHVPTVDRSVWERFDSPLWRRVGPYLLLKCAERDFESVFDGLLADGILISPSFPGPSIIPAQFSEGEIRPLLRAGGRGSKHGSG